MSAGIPAPRQVLLVDDHADVRRVVRAYLERSGRFRVTAEACEGAEAIAQSEGRDIDVIVLDLTMPGTDGLAALPALRALQPDARIVVFSAAIQDFSKSELAALGADAIVAKTDGLSALGAAINGTDD